MAQPRSQSDRQRHGSPTPNKSVNNGQLLVARNIAPVDSSLRSVRVHEQPRRGDMSIDFPTHDGLMVYRLRRHDARGRQNGGGFYLHGHTG